MSSRVRHPEAFEYLIGVELIVGDVIDLIQGRRHIAARRGFSGWQRRFGGLFDEKTCPKDLPDSVLLQLIQADSADGAIEEFVLGVLCPGAAVDISDLDPAVHMAAMDITLFLLDQFRFEAMRRLGWVVEPPLSSVSLLEMIETFEHRYAAVRHQTPALAPAHPKYRDYLQTFEEDRGSFIRRLTPDAIAAFENRVRRRSPPTG